MPKPIHILYADDDEMIRRLIGGRLSKSGFEIVYASDGNEAREMARRLHPDLILLDYRMPVLDGLKVATYLKREAPTKDIPVILLTNEDFPMEGEAFWKEISLDAYLHKSVDYAELYKTIVDVLKKHGREADIPKPVGKK